MYLITCITYKFLHQNSDCLKNDSDYGMMTAAERKDMLDILNFSNRTFAFQNPAQFNECFLDSLPEGILLALLLSASALEPIAPEEDGIPSSSHEFYCEWNNANIGFICELFHGNAFAVLDWRICSIRISETGKRHLIITRLQAKKTPLLLKIPICSEADEHVSLAILSSH